MTSLDSRSLGDVAASGVPVPAYDRTQLTAGIVHFGVGGFHRAHEAMLLDRLMNEGKAFEWAICGVGVLPGDRRMFDIMARQDCLYTLVVKHPDGRREPRVIGSIIEYLFAPDDTEAVVEKLADERTKIVSLTITEGGYNIDAVTGGFDERNPAVVADLEHPQRPATVFGLVVEGLARRRARGIAPFTVVSCDNIQGNGDIARNSFATYASLIEPSFGDWLRVEVPFPNSMVDRITPVTTGEDRAELRETFAIDDDWPVVCEPFVQWVLEDEFRGRRPPLEAVGVQLVADVGPYELMKLRLLNASHQALAYFGYLAGYRLVHEVCQDPAFAGFLLAYMDEATPTLSPVPGIDLDAYKRQLVERFSNPHVRDTVARLATDASDRIPKFLLPVIRENLAAGRPVTLSASIVASWARYAEGVDDAGDRIDVVDPLRDRLVAAARRQGDEPLAFVADRSLFGDLVDDERFTAAFLAAASSLRTVGARATVEQLAGREAGRD